MLSDHGWACVSEVTLANHRRADILAISARGEIMIVEVKSCLSDFASDQKWPEYLPWCDQFCFAVDGDFPIDRLPEEAQVGVIVADGFGGDFVREAEVDKLAGARRKAITLKFARLAADRLYRHLSASMS